jgi:hypothetical protein
MLSNRERIEIFMVKKARCKLLLKQLRNTTKKLAKNLNHSKKSTELSAEVFFREPWTLAAALTFFPLD